MQFFKKNKTAYRRFANFSTVGIVTTIFGLSLFYILIILLSINIYASYVIVFIFSVGFSAIVNSIFIYGRAPSINLIVIFYKSYLISFLLGLALIMILEYFLPSLDDFVLIVLVILFRTIATFVFVEKFLNLKAK